MTMRQSIITDLATGEVTTIDLPPLTLDELMQARLTELASQRWLRETGGIVVQGMPIKTDRESQGLLTSAYVMATRDPDFTVRWKIENGLFVEISAALIIMAGDAVTMHVQACFDNEAAHTAALVAAYQAQDAEALNAIDIGANWP